MPHEMVYISIGSNIEPDIHIPNVVRMLSEHNAIGDLCVSSFYINEALGRPDQPYYRNGVARFTTELEPEALKIEVLRKIEHECGRIRTKDLYSPRTIDLDIILFGDRIITNDSMTIPDPAIWQHVFVTIPLLEIEPSPNLPGRDEVLTFEDSVALPKDDSLNSLT
jgi:2-amino-4-hydroxy-6-hydroxymethyldihydropteridine diphosphokinase